MTRVLTVSARYPSDADAAFEAAQSFAEMAEATRGVAVYRNLPVDPMREGERYVIDVTVWGVMKNPEYTVYVERLDKTARRIQSREEGWMIRQWDHTLSIDETGDGGCRWTDRIVVDCSWATAFMVRVARVIYRTRLRNRGGSEISAVISRP
jgi:hypothetical protein